MSTTGSIAAMDTFQSAVFMQFSAMHAQPAVGLPAQRGEWLGTLGRASNIAATPPGPFASRFQGSDCNLRHAEKILQGVRSQMAAAGIQLADMQSGLAASAARFRTEVTSGGNGHVLVMKDGGVRPEYDFEVAERLSLSRR